MVHFYTLDAVAKFQLGHFFAEMDRRRLQELCGKMEAEFQLGHFFAEMEVAGVFSVRRVISGVSIGPLLSEMDRRVIQHGTSKSS